VERTMIDVDRLLDPVDALEAVLASFPTSTILASIAPRDDFPDNIARVHADLKKPQER
jgi:hypothetical protein